MDADALKLLCERHEAFWNGEGETPLRRVTAHTPLKPRSAMPLADGSQLAEGQVLLPERIDPSRFYGPNPGPKALVNGDFISAEAYVPVTWATHVDQETGRPVENPEAHYANEQKRRRNRK